MQDYRVGTYYDENGTAHRVNGTIQGNHIKFRIDSTVPNLAYDEWTGLMFYGYMFTQNPTTFAGHFADTGVTYGFYATQEAWLKPDASPGGAFSTSQYVGSWNMNHDGWQGTLNITSVNAVTGMITASYKDALNKTHPVTGKVASGARSVNFSIAFDAAGPQAFTGYLHSWDRGVMSGTTTWGGGTFGWTAERHNLTLTLPGPSIQPIQILP